MRELLFRIWEKDIKRMSQEFDIVDYADDKDSVFGVGDLPRITSPHVIIMQFTGLTDKNGVKIFEGDIIKGLNRSSLEAGNDKETAVVSFYKGCFRESYWCENVFEVAERCEVIGNKFENPELLET